MTAIIIHRPFGNILGLELFANIGFVLASVSACFALAAVFLRFAVTRSPLLQSLSKNAYGIYLVHYLFVVWLQYLLLGTALPSFAKGILVFTAALGLSWPLVAGARNLSHRSVACPTGGLVKAP
jgi:surface polysaccharide O-acyltransferase-like enzyme